MFQSKSVRFAGLHTLLLSILFPPAQAFAEEVPKVSFRSDIAPLLNDHCYACHCSKRAEGGYRVDTIEKFFVAGDSSELPIAPESETLGEVYVRIVAQDLDVRMPAEHAPLTSEQIDAFKRWISQGAQIDSEERTTQLWSIIPPKQYAPPPEKYPQSFPITAVSFQPDGGSIMVSGYHEVLQRKTEDGSILKRIQNHPQRLNRIYLDGPKGLLFAAGGSPGKLGELRSFNLESGALDKVLSRSAEIILDFTPRPNSTEIAIAGGDTSVKLVDYATGELKRTFFSHADWVTQIAFSSDGSKMASSSLDKSCKVYDLTTGEVIANYTHHNAAVRGIVGYGDGSEWISIAANNQLHRWKVEGTATVANVPLVGEPTRITLTDDAAFVLHRNKHWSHVSLAENKVVRNSPMNSEPASLSVHPESKILAVGTMDGTVQLWNLFDGAKIREFNANP